MTRPRRHDPPNMNDRTPPGHASNSTGGENTTDAGIVSSESVDFDAGIEHPDGGRLLPVAVEDVDGGGVLMLAWMNREALSETLRTGRATYYSRSRRELWIKGLTSGHVQEVVDVRVDCDGDAVVLVVRQTGAACHTGQRTCFFRSVREPRAGQSGE